MKIGDYVRTKYGEIAKIDKCLGKDNVYKSMQHYETDRMVTKFNNFILYEEDIYKSSPNIIDLIEDGDYVNGKRVTDIDIAKKKIYVEEMYYFNKKDIKSIVTKEQFEAMQYKVGE